MTITEIQEILQKTVKAAAWEAFNIDLATVAVETPPNASLGDAAFPAAFEIAKIVKQQTGEKQNPRAIAETLKAAIDGLSMIGHTEIAGPGYLNVFFDRASFLTENADAAPLADIGRNSAKVCIEHTSVNPNKAAHIGHVRNSVLGDTFRRILTATGKQVEVQNYIDNTGVQVADVVVGFMYIEDRDLDAIKALDAELKAAGKSFDYYCWDLYAKVGQAYLEDEELKAKRAEVLHLIEEGGNATADLADYVATRNVECILDTMERLSIRYDLLPRESEILHLHFWDKAFEQMKQLGVIYFVEDGKQKGCWVMPFEEHAGTDEHETDKILVRSNGTVTYTGKDIAYQMWKLGILGLDFNYRRFFRYADGKEVWITTSIPPANNKDAGSPPDFGGGESIYNVIDTRQSYPQEIVKKGVAAISPERGEKASVHLAYEMVALSPAAAEQLGFELSDDDRKRTFIEMSGRKGLGVKADDLIDRLEANALKEVDLRNPEDSLAVKEHIAHQIAVGALRYFLLKFTRNTVIVFDFDEALSFDGETGAFCQYSAVRANSIFRKLAAEGGYKGLTGLSREQLDGVLSGDPETDVWALLVLACRLDETVRQAAKAAEPAILAKYTFNLAKAFNSFYRDHKIVSEPDAAKREVLIAVADAARRSLTASLNTLGIDVPEKM
ncbi:MAG: arginine--tRNA ligase [Chloracidobacterium sp.]|nr:arginine--tRNA ligase [Chloracidobacterium sp.]MCO5334024.1 arginine--tRNA ligase [Pyrinomonadaceae bacterium]